MAADRDGLVVLIADLHRLEVSTLSSIWNAMEQVVNKYH
jgi:hypothetical protein